MKAKFFIFIILFFLVGCLESSVAPSVAETAPLLPPDHGTAPVVETSGSVKYQVRLGDRYFIKSILTKVFLSEDSSSSSDAGVAAIIKNTFFDQGNYYGGNCSVYDSDDCQVHKSTDYQSLSTVPTVNVSAEAGFVNACAEILDVNGVISVLENKLGLTGVEDYSLNFGNKAYQLFYPGKTLSEEASTAFKDLYVQAKADGDRVSGWKSIYYSLCLSPQWRIP